jgi:hypothetical protein
MPITRSPASSYLVTPRNNAGGRLGCRRPVVRDVDGAIAEDERIAWGREYVRSHAASRVAEWQRNYDTIGVKL